MWGSKPHFLDCDPSVRDAVEGLREPDEIKDDVFADIEPVRNDVTILLNILPYTRSLGPRCMPMNSFKST